MSTKVRANFKGLSEIKKKKRDEIIMGLAHEYVYGDSVIINTLVRVLHDPRNPSNIDAIHHWIDNGYPFSKNEIISDVFPLFVMACIEDSPINAEKYARMILEAEIPELADFAAFTQSVRLGELTVLHGDDPRISVF